ncbi:hypothetical protein UlMin_014275 [Ulmus minor]
MALNMGQRYLNRIERLPMHTSIRTGHQYMLELLNQHPDRIFNKIRMYRPCFEMLIQVTISVVFTRICKAIASLSQTFIKPPNFDAIPDEIRWNPKYYPYFQNCVGAIDGTHIAAHAPADMANNFRGRKSTITSNM